MENLIEKYNLHHLRSEITWLINALKLTKEYEESIAYEARLHLPKGMIKSILYNNTWSKIDEAGQGKAHYTRALLWVDNFYYFGITYWDKTGEIYVRLDGLK